MTSDPKLRRQARKARQQTERQAARDLDSVTGEAISEALRLAPEVANATARADVQRVIDVGFGAIDEARFAQKRVNEALSVDEWLGDVRVWVWDARAHRSEPLSEVGRARGFELRIERVP